MSYFLIRVAVCSTRQTKICCGLYYNNSIVEIEHIYWCYLTNK